MFGKVNGFDSFAERLVKTLRTNFPGSPPTMSKAAALRGKLWRKFHSMRINQLPTMWKDSYSELGWDDQVPDVMLEQYKNQRLLPWVSISQLALRTVQLYFCPFSVTAFSSR